MRALHRHLQARILEHASAVAYGMWVCSTQRACGREACTGK